MKLLFWKIAKAYNLADFNDAVEEMNAINEEVVTAFKSYNPKLFCRAYLDISMKTDAITSNMAETFNGYIINARTKHLIYMLEDIRISLMQRLVVKRQAMQKSTSTVCQRIQVKLDQEKTKAANCDVIPSTDTLFNVNYYLDQLVVDLEAKTCSCRKWNMLGYPCCHAVACIYFLNKEAEDFVEDCYKRETYLKAYAGSIPPIDGERYWPRVEYGLDPPPIKIGPGRPRVNRRKDPMEDPKKPGTLQRTGMEMTCSICHVKGHNKRRCPNKDTASAPTEPPPKRSRGRPRKDGQPPISHSQVAQSSTAHHNATAQPTQLGRGGRMCRGGAGSRGGRTTSRGGGQHQVEDQGEAGHLQEEEGEETKYLSEFCFLKWLVLSRFQLVLGCILHQMVQHTPIKVAVLGMSITKQANQANTLHCTKQLSSNFNKKKIWFPVELFMYVIRQ
ncbi:uncharacterized protein [Spinacia oleracea]|uniref:SWIM-type domain-containing protein n=1 Tax=Spinacia oleracea TaxID=3562 RepID=A0ABM3RSS7_SPIOL|nr:uncharacterized protein LOC130472198 [Spinacia oleracea]